MDAESISIFLIRNNAAYFVVGMSFRHYKFPSRCKTAGGEGNPAKLYRVMWYVIVGFTISQPLRFKVEIIKQISDTTETHKFPLRYTFTRKFPSEPTKTIRATEPVCAFTLPPSGPPRPTSSGPPKGIYHRHPPPNRSFSHSPSTLEPSSSSVPGVMPSRGNPTDPSDEPPNELSPANSTTSNESFYSLSPEMNHANGERGVGKPWSRVDGVLHKEFAREKKAGKLSFEKKVEMYGEKLEEKFKELEERLLTREEELLLKGRELQRIPPQFILIPFSFSLVFGLVFDPLLAVWCDVIGLDLG